ncbi:acyl carrier protein [Streptomyces canus]|uniref:phosphopantetheine-binding protein n=1 Tax=Streptomyces canus TaxID=58343 RepID=UPI00277E0383|nr:phosphopantetheine-binding protein [Streptomyces canus]MDQ0599364.1 acyl carrier protein [Streptomyces canus]
MSIASVTLADVEAVVLAVTAEALNVPEVHLDDNLLELGVDSLVATRIVAALRTRFGADIPLLNIFEYPELREFAISVLDTIQDAPQE